MVDTGDRLTHADVERIVELVENSGFGFVRLESDGLELTLEREGYVGAGHAQSAPRGTHASAPVHPGPPPPVPVSAPEKPGADDERAVVVSPTVGIFYRAPEPDAPPYVEVGQVVEAGATIGLVEVMKMFTAVRAEIPGRVAEVLVENGQQVERGQHLVRIVDA